ncbi:MAG: type II toxin-antitoxin system HicB family antitoxin, partial [Sphaerochaetaceae bacterium]
MRKIEEYLKLPYTIELKKEEDGSYFISIKELEGCFSVGDTIEEAIEMIEDAKKAWITVSLEEGNPIPEPDSMDTKSYSGRFVTRVSPALHKKLALQAKANGVSLNHHVCEILASTSSVIDTQGSILESLVGIFRRQSSKLYTSGNGRLGIQKESSTQEWKTPTNVMEFPCPRK